MGDPQPIRVVLADDHQVVRQGIRDFLAANGIEVVAEADNGEEAFQLIVKHRPNVAVLDIQMPGISGIEVTRQVRGARLPVGILVLTAFDDDPYVMAALEAGVNGFVLKTSEAEEIVKAVQAISRQQSVLDPALVDKVMQAASGRKPLHTSPIETLTPRELDVLYEVAKGETNKAIALTLDISDRTVQGHLRNIYEKLHVSNRTEAVVKASQLGRLTLPETYEAL